jgi:hypothetical protein
LSISLPTPSRQEIEDYYRRPIARGPKPGPRHL